MTPERLEQIRQHILNPPSASLNREMMMELVREVERLGALPVEVTEVHVVDRIPVEVVPSVVASVDPLVVEPTPVVIDDRKPKKGRRK